MTPFTLPFDFSLVIILKTYSSIDLAEDRDRFRDLLNKLNLNQAESGIARTFPQAIKIADKIGLPLMVRPSYVCLLYTSPSPRDDT